MGDGVVSTESLRSELLALAGVADAQVETNGEVPTGVHIRLGPETDADAVRTGVQRILAAHGMRSRVAAGSELEPPQAPVPPLPAAEALVVEPPRSPLAASDTAPAGPAGGLESVGVKEGASGVIVTAMARDGREEMLEGAATEEDLMRTVIAAVGTLAQGSAPNIIAVEWTAAGASEVVTVVVEGAGGFRSAGACLVAASRAYAVGRATWLALQ